MCTQSISIHFQIRCSAKICFIIITHVCFGLSSKRARRVLEVRWFRKYRVSLLWPDVPKQNGRIWKPPTISLCIVTDKTVVSGRVRETTMRHIVVVDDVHYYYCLSPLFVFNYTVKQWLRRDFIVVFFLLLLFFFFFNFVPKTHTKIHFARVTQV